MTISLSNKNWAGGGESSNFDKQVTYVTCKTQDSNKVATVILGGSTFEGRTPNQVSPLMHFDGSWDGENHNLLDIVNGYTPAASSTLIPRDPGKYGVGYNFSGVDRYFNMQGLPFPTYDTGFTITFWFYRTVRSVSYGYLMQGREDLAGDTEYFTLNLNKYNGWQISITNATNGTVALSTDPDVPQYSWMHTAFVFDRSTVKCYIDGVLKNTQTCDLSAPGVTNPKPNFLNLKFGASYNGGQGIGGYLDDIKFFNQPLTQEQVELSALDTIETDASTYATELINSINASNQYTASLLPDTTATVRIISLDEEPYAVSIENIESYEILPKNFDETQEIIDAKSDVGHAHTESDITDMDKYTQAEVDSLCGYVEGPITPISEGTKGQWSYDSTSSQIFRCVDDDTWVRYTADIDW